MSADPKAAQWAMTKLLEAWAAGEGQTLPRQTHCGGAFLYVSKDEATAFEQRRVRFEPYAVERLPVTGRDGIRVVCVDNVVVHKGVIFGLCSRCAAFEKEVREGLAGLRKTREATQPNGPRRGDFDR